MFLERIDSDKPRPYGSYNNGAAMQISPMGDFHRNGVLEEALTDAERVTSITHNHEEDIRAALAITHAIWLSYHGEYSNGIRQAVEAEEETDRTKASTRSVSTPNSTKPAPCR